MTGQLSTHEAIGCEKDDAKIKIVNPQIHKAGTQKALSSGKLEKQFKDRTACITKRRWACAG